MHCKQSCLATHLSLRVLYLRTNALIMHISIMQSIIIMLKITFERNLIPCYWECVQLEAAGDVGVVINQVCNHFINPTMLY